MDGKKKERKGNEKYECLPLNSTIAILFCNFYFFFVLLNFYFAKLTKNKFLKTQFRVKKGHFLQRKRVWPVPLAQKCYHVLN
jgi:hypothetical protein